MCFGVRDAVTLALDQPGPLTVLGELVHNDTVLRRLREHGIQIKREPAAVATSAVMITAHGASQRRLAEVRKLVCEGYHPVIIGQRDHVEVRGIIEDLDAFDVVLTEQDVTRLAARPRFGITAQTTQPIDRVKRLVAALAARFPKSAVRFVDTVCQPTKMRQHAAAELARQCDVVVVIGGANSNNTRELAATCAAHCSRVHHVQSADDLRPEWFADAETVGFTAGTSTPDEAIDAVERRIRQLAMERSAAFA
jgi:4-hydroxy-3-methylbut-2-enyl diphosphate reductase